MDLEGEGIGRRPADLPVMESMQTRLEELGREGSRLAAAALASSLRLARKLRRSAFELLCGEELQGLRGVVQAAEVAKAAAGEAGGARDAALEAASHAREAASEAAAAAGEARQASLAARAEFEAMALAAVASLNESANAGQEAARAAREAAEEAAREAARAAVERIKFEHSGPATAIGGEAKAVLDRLEQDYLGLSELIREVHAALAPPRGDPQADEQRPGEVTDSFDPAAEDAYETPEQALPRVWPSLRRAV